MRIVVVLMLTGLTGLMVWSFFRARRDPVEPAGAASETIDAQPVAAIPTDGYVSSESCRACHPQEHASWHDTYHRTMTQVVSPETVQAPISEREIQLTTRGRTSALWREGDEYWIEMIDPDWEIARSRQGLGSVTDAEDPPKVQRQLVMSTGSHHIQTFWVNGARGNEMHQVPWSYHLLEKRWIPLNDIFLLPPDTPANLLTLWNEVCIQCHTVHAEPGLNHRSGVFQSRVSELGVACEACHGPGAEHVALFAQQAPPSPHSADPQASQHTSAADGPATDGAKGRTNASELPDDLRIVNPLRLPHDRSAHVCGQCHSDFMIIGDRFWTSGHPYRPGADLTQTRAFPEPQPGMEAYWNDGTARVGGREFTAMARSGCYERGELSCLSCHSMHNAPPSDQLAADRDGDEACFQCHAGYRDHDRLEAHTHHAADSSGSRCYNCHMPFSSFALMKALRSHRIDSPRAELTSRYGRPNACNQCHLDQPLAWTAETLAAWYGPPRADADSGAVGNEPPTTASDTGTRTDAAPVQPAVASAVELLLTGDAVQRAVTAANFGWQPAQDVSGRDWPPALLSFLLKDPYAVVRFAAWRALRTYPGYGEFEYDFLAPPEEREEAAGRALQHWRRIRAADAPAVPAALIGPGAELDLARIRALLQQRNDRPVRFPE